MSTSKPRRKSKAPWTKELKADDPVFEEPDRHDMVVIVMGPTGVGKSTFINAYMGEEVTKVSDRMESCTQQISYHPRVLPDSHPTCPGRRLVLIDTPGFDDTYNPQYETLRRISVALASTYDKDLKVGSVLYINSVTQKRMFGSMRLDFEMFSEICGKRACPSVTVATTHWDSAELEAVGAGLSREEEFRTNFWKDIIEAGASLERIQDYQSDPERIIDRILLKAQEKDVHTRALQIQEELVEKEKFLAETEAAKKLRFSLADIMELLKATPVSADLEQYRKKMADVQDQLEALHVPLLEKFKEVFRFKRGSSSKRDEVIPESSERSSLN